jgi:hypothetical protein
MNLCARRREWALMEGRDPVIQEIERLCYFQEWTVHYGVRNLEPLTAGKFTTS